MSSSSGIDNSFIDKLKNKVNIVDVISRYIPLQKRGRSIMACCPFHMEKTPSFHINESEQFYHCFGCGDGGDVIKFVRKFENVDFLKAVEIIAKIAGIELPEVIYNKEIVELKKKREKLFEINKFAAKHYNNVLFSSDGEKAYKYLAKRGLSRKTIIKFGLGYSKNFNDIYSFLKSEGYSDSDIIDSGVCQKGKGKPYDAYCERITFPIIDTYNQVVGFSARTLKTDSNIAKYKNTGANMIFDKSKILYGLNNVKKLKQTEGISEIIVLEGQMDVIKLFEAGIKNCVACLGTALTRDHALMLKRFSEKIVLSLDGDSAGQKAMFKSIDVLEEQNLDVRVIKIPNKLDPDEFVSKYGKNAFLTLLASAKTGTEFKLQALANEFNLKDSFEKGKFIKKALDLLKSLSDIDKEIYLESLSKIAGLPIDILRRNLKSTETKTIEKNKEENTSSGYVNDGFVTARKFVLAALLHKKSYANAPSGENFDLVDADLKKLFELINNNVKIGDLYSQFNEEDSPEVFEIICYNFNGFENVESEEKFFVDSVKQIKLKTLETKKDDINEKIKTTLDNTERVKLIGEMKNVLDQIKKIKTEEF